MEEDLKGPDTGPGRKGGGGFRLPILLLAITAGILAFFTHPDVVKQEPESPAVTGMQ